MVCQVLVIHQGNLPGGNFLEQLAIIRLLLGRMGEKEIGLAMDQMSNLNLLYPELHITI